MKMETTYSIVLLLFYIKIVNSAFFFPSNSAYGIFAALAVPLDLGPHRNVFVSYNFEANYNLPVNWQLPSYLEFGDTRRMKQHIHKDTEKDSISKNVELNKLEISDFDRNVKIDINSTKKNTIILGASEAVNTTESILGEEEQENEKDTSRERRSLLSRRTFYNMLIQRFEMYEYNGQSCLLRLICETNASGIGENNGFLGSIIHIIFAPSSSEDEKLSNVYYRAEFDGQKEQCKKYWKKCPHNLLDLITTPVYDIINSLRTN